MWAIALTIVVALGMFIAATLVWRNKSSDTNDTGGSTGGVPGGTGDGGSSGGRPPKT